VGTLAKTGRRSHAGNCLSFTAASLRPELACVIAQVHWQQADWRGRRRKTAVLTRNARSRPDPPAVLKRLESELRQRYRPSPPAQLVLLATGWAKTAQLWPWLASLKADSAAFDVVAGRCCRESCRDGSGACAAPTWWRSMTLQELIHPNWPRWPRPRAEDPLHSPAHVPRSRIAGW